MPELSEGNILTGKLSVISCMEQARLTTHFYWEKTLKEEIGYIRLTFLG